MSAKPKSLKDYCAMLGVSPSARRDEIQLAYVLRRREVETSREYTEAELKEAYEALTGAGREARLAGGGSPLSSGGRASRGGMAAHRSSVSAVGLLVALLAALAGVVAFYLWPTYAYRFRTFRPNDQIIEASTGRPFATVLEARKGYVFPNGKVGAAYRLRLEPDGSEVWVPATDVQYTCVRR